MGRGVAEETHRNDIMENNFYWIKKCVLKVKSETRAIDNDFGIEHDS